jgi:hypothetical protein
MARTNALVLASVLTLAGCGGTGNLRSPEELAVEHVVQARLLEGDGRWYEAATEYAIVADLYPESSYYETAVRKAAALFSHPDNVGVTDSTALRWLQEYGTLSLNDGERSMLETHIRILSELRTVRENLQIQSSLSDSLTTVSRRQHEELIDSEKRIRKLETDLERELAEARKELERLRQIDLEVGRDKGKD